MSVHKRMSSRSDGSKQTSWRVRWRDDEDRLRSRTFDRKRDADDFDADLRRRRRLGSLAELDAGTETLDEYVVQTWIPIHAHTLSPKTRLTYSRFYDRNISPYLGGVALRSFSVELIGRWQSDRLAAGAGAVSIRQSLGLLGNILQRAHEGGRITSNPARLVRKAKAPRRAEVKPFAPATVEAIRAQMKPRDAMLVSLLAYAGLRPGEALALRWSDIRDHTILVERAVSMGAVKPTKTTQSRTVRLLDPLAHDLAEWRMRCGRPKDSELVIPDSHSGPWSEEAFKSWGRRTFATALSNVLGGDEPDPIAKRCPACGVLAGKPCRTPKRKTAPRPHVERTRLKVDGRPYDLRHSFASLLLHEGRSVIYVARQLGHGAQLTLSTYGHVIDELEDAPSLDAEAAIRAARDARGHEYGKDLTSGSRTGARAG